MRKNPLTFFLIITMIVLTFLLQGCASSTNSTDLSSSENSLDTPAADSSTANETLLLDISYKVYSDVVKDEDGTQLVQFRFSYPYIDNLNNHEGIAAINNYYQTQLEQFINTVVPEGKKAALEVKKAAEENGFDFHNLYYEREASVYYNDNQLLSVLNIGYENTGGAHPVSYWSSETFDVKTGRLLSLSDIFGLSKEEVLEKVYETVISQIESTTEEDYYYFENYEENVKNYYSENDFILGSNGIIFYYQLYTIAPYVAGIPTFELPYDKAGDLAVQILPLEPNDLEREVYLQAGRLIEANKDVFCNIFGLAMLPLELPENISGEQSLYPVKDNRFLTFSNLDNYIRGIYVKSEADALMNNGRYIDKNGKLYGNINKDAGMGYYIDLNNYRFEVNDISENSATITIHVVDYSPAGREEKTIKVNMQKENNRWLLEKMFC